MKPIILSVLVLLLAANPLSAVEIRTTAEKLLLSGDRCSLELRRTDGALLAARIDGAPFPLSGLRDGLWKAKFLDGSTLTAAQAGKAVLKRDGERITFNWDDERIAVSVTVTPSGACVDFQGEFTPKRQPVIEFGAPGRLNFPPEAVDGVTCHIRKSTNPGTTLRSGFFAPGARSGEEAYYRQSKVHHSRNAELLFGGPFRNLGDKHRPRAMTAGADAPEYLEPGEIAKLRTLRLSPTRPFAEGQAEIALLTDGDNVVAGGSRFGGTGAFIRWGVFRPDSAGNRTIMELTAAMIRKLFREKRFDGKRTKVALLSLNGEAIARPAISEWKKELRKAVPEIELITGPGTLKKALLSPETAAIVNPYSEHGIAVSGKTMPETMALLKRYVRSGGCWFETGGYSFYYELSPAAYLTSGLQSSPGSLADFFHLGLAGKEAALYAVQPITWKPFAASGDPDAVFLPSFFELGGEPQGGFLDRSFAVYAEPGKPFRTPVSRLRFHTGALESLQCFAADNRISRKLSEKAAPELIEKTRNSVLFHPKRFSNERGIRETLPLLPSPVIIHISSYLKGGFDKEYPDHLPPNRWWGTMEGFRSLIAEISERGMLFMPYTNNTWWCDHPRGPAFLAAGEAPLQRGLGGRPFHEQYANNDGWSICMWHPAVRAANEKLVRQFTRELPADILFQDQTGVRGGVSVTAKSVSRTWDRNPASPAPHAVVEGFLSQMRSDSEKIPLATEEGWWGLIDGEFMFCGFSGGLCRFMEWMGDFRDHWPRHTWNLFPMIQALAHEKAFLGHHDLAADVDTPERVSWTLALGYGMTSRANPRDPAERQWLFWLDRLQKSVCARYAGGGVSAFRHEWGKDGETGVIRAVYGPVAVVANLGGAPLQEGRYTVAPGGFLASGGGVTAGELLACGGEKHPASFVAEKEKVWLYGAPGTEAAFPLSAAPSAIRCGGKPVEFRFDGGTAVVKLPAHAEPVRRVWELELLP
ncbi:MAG: hypothetical protein HPZ91_18530 [Lentisphaeria bacterium]|nr:hypothetical protein [Lentisphaeria bacterium]